VETFRGSQKPIEIYEEFRRLTLQVIGEAILSLTPEESDRVFPHLYLPIMVRAPCRRVAAAAAAAAAAAVAARALGWCATDARGSPAAPRRRKATGARLSRGARICRRRSGSTSGVACGS
jgi:cytochrome P450